MVNVGDKIVATRDQYYTVNKGTVMVVTKNMRDGDVCARIHESDDNYSWFMPAGSYEPYGQTLAELGVKAGDVAECVETHTGYFTLGKKYVSKKDSYINYDDGGECQASSSKFIIISRATPTPTTIPTLWRDMTDAEKGALLLAKHEGKGIEYRNEDGYWSVLFIQFFDDHAYRIKPTPVTRTVDLMADFKVIGTITLIDGTPDPASIKMASV